MLFMQRKFIKYSKIYLTNRLITIKYLYLHLQKYNYYEKFNNPIN